MSVAPHQATVIHAARIVSGQDNVTTVLVHQVNVTKAHSILSSGGRISGRLAKSCSFFYDKKLKTESCCGCVSLRRASCLWALVGLLCLLGLSITFVASDQIEKHREETLGVFIVSLMQIGSLAVILWSLSDRNRFRLGKTMHNAARFLFVLDLIQACLGMHQAWQEISEDCEEFLSPVGSDQDDNDAFRNCQRKEFAWIILGHSVIGCMNFYGCWIFLATAQYYRICQAILNRPNPIQDGDPVVVRVNPAPLDNEQPPRFQADQQQSQPQAQRHQSQYVAASGAQALKSVDEEQIAMLQRQLVK